MLPVQLSRTTKAVKTAITASPKSCPPYFDLSVECVTTGEEVNGEPPWPLSKGLYRHHIGCHGFHLAIFQQIGVVKHGIESDAGF
jgi:hypothetical protein